MVIKEKLGKPIGEGSEKRVYQDPEQEDRVIGVFEEEMPEQTPNQIKARFYLTKILHLLFPKNIPDMHWAGSEPNAYQADKKEHSEAHKAIHGKESSISYADAAEIIEGDSSVANLIRELEKIGIRSFDYSIVNYSHDSEGNALYLDTFYAWKKRYDGTLKLFCDFEKLENEIKALSEDDKDRGEDYLRRLKELYEAEQNN